MKRAGIVAVTVLIVAAALVPFLIDWNRFKPMVENAASEALGRALAIDGDLSVSLAPTASVSASQIRLANAPGMAAAPMASIERVGATIRLLPLLGGRLVIDQLEVVDPDLSLEIAADGAPNWRFEPATRPSAQPAKAGLPLQEFVLDGIQVRGGRIGFIDHRSDRTLELRDLELSAAATAKGASPDQLLSSLSGEAEIGFAELSLPGGPVRQLRAAKVMLELPPDGADADLRLEATATRGGGDGLPPDAGTANRLPGGSDRRRPTPVRVAG